LPTARIRQTVVESKANCRLTDKVTEVIENLLDNAFRAVVERPSGLTGGVITVTLSLSDASTAKLRVTDNGAGISEKDKPLVFTFGYTTRPKKGASHGIGLWFCQLYALQVGGKLTFDSNEGQGSWFELEFPTSEV
jgi:signal transduction histidine kinase